MCWPIAITHVTITFMQRQFHTSMQTAPYRDQVEIGAKMLYDSQSEEHNNKIVETIDLKLGRNCVFSPDLCQIHGERKKHVVHSLYLQKSIFVRRFLCVSLLNYPYKIYIFRIVYVPDTWPFSVNPNKRHSIECHPNEIPAFRWWAMCLAVPAVRFCGALFRAHRPMGRMGYHCYWSDSWPIDWLAAAVDAIVTTPYQYPCEWEWYSYWRLAVGFASTVIWWLNRSAQQCYQPSLTEIYCSRTFSICAWSRRFPNLKKYFWYGRNVKFLCVCVWHALEKNNNRKLCFVFYSKTQKVDTKSRIDVDSIVEKSMLKKLRLFFY